MCIRDRFSPSQNAQNFFKNYKKKQTAARMLVDLLAEGEKEIAYLETVLYEVESASGEAALNEIRMELKNQGYLKYYKPVSYTHLRRGKALVAAVDGWLKPKKA